MNLRRLIALAFVTGAFLSSPAFALLTRGNGVEPILIEVRPSLRLSDDFDFQLQALAGIESELSLTVLSRFVGSKYLELVSFPSPISPEQAQAAIVILLQQAFVEKVVPVSASNLVYRSGDFMQAYAPNEIIPEAVRRGLDSGPTPPFDPSVVLRPHEKNRLIVSWKPEFIWHAERTGFLQQIAEFNAALGCRVVSEARYSANELTQVLAFSGPDSLLASKLQRYLASGWVRNAQPNFIYGVTSSVPVPRPALFLQNRDRGGVNGLRRQEN